YVLENPVCWSAVINMLPFRTILDINDNHRFERAYNQVENRNKLFDSVNDENLPALIDYTIALRTDPFWKFE
ncbi:MAG: hypothetical protein MHPSP_004404, partial [Paramarteilia canceri]